MRRLSLAFLLVLIAFSTSAAERWEMLPPTPAPIPATRSGNANVNGISIYYAVYGNGSPIIFWVATSQSLARPSRLPVNTVCPSNPNAALVT